MDPSESEDENEQMSSSMPSTLESLEIDSLPSTKKRSRDLDDDRGGKDVIDMRVKKRVRKKFFSDDSDIAA